MADDKKPDAKPAPAPPASFFSHPDPFVEVVWIILALVVLSYLLNAFLSGILPIFSGDYTTNELALRIRDFIFGIFFFILSLKYFFVFLYLVLAFCIYYLFRKISVLRLNEMKLLYPEVVMEEKGLVNLQWERILAHTESLSESDWRLAILEADIMLSDMLEKLALPGETISEKLKSVEKSDFTTIDSAWEGHKVRNQIAHEGASFMLNHRETKRVISLFETVFKEFRII